MVSTQVSAFHFSLSGDIAGVTNASFDENLDSAFGGEIAFGTNFSDDLFFELSYVHSQSERTQTSLNYVEESASEVVSMTADSEAGFGAIIGSLYYKFDTDSSVKPFVGFGAGVGQVEYTLSNFTSSTLYPDSAPIHEKETNFITHLSCGAEYEFTESISAIVKYDLYNSSFLDTVERYGILSSHMFNLGMKIKF